MTSPDVAASTTRSASSGDSRRVTTDDGMASPLFDLSCSYFVPAVRTVTLLTTMRVSPVLFPLRVTKTSTRLPGVTNPATPTNYINRRTGEPFIPGKEEDR